MSQSEYESYLEMIPYDALGDYSTFSENTHVAPLSDQDKCSKEK